MNESPPRSSLTKSELVAAVRRLKRLPAKPLDIQTPGYATCLPYLDILELYLKFCGVSDWRWMDSHSSVVNQTTAQIIRNLLRDLGGWAPLYFRYSAQVDKLSHCRRKVDFRPSSSILFLRTDHWFNIQSGGSVTHLRGVIHGFKNLGFVPTIVSSDLLQGVEADSNFHLLRPRYELGRNLPNIPELLYNDQLLEFLASETLPRDFSFVYQRQSLGNYSGLWTARGMGIPYVCEFNGSEIWATENWSGQRIWHRGLLNRIELLNLKAADLVVVVSEALRNSLTQRGVDPSRILVNPNGVDPVLYSPDISGAQVRAEYGLDDKTVIGFIGTFGLWHGAEVLVNAFAELLSSDEGYKRFCRLLMVGDGPTWPAVKARISALGLDKYVILTGSVPQSSGPQYLAACDLFASPHVPNADGSFFFGSPTKLFEYMAMGKGIVASDLDQIGKILSHQKIGWLVKPGDSSALASGLRELLAEDRLRAALGGAARAKVLESYTWDRHTRRIIDALSAVTGTDMLAFGDQD